MPVEPSTLVIHKLSKRGDSSRTTAVLVGPAFALGRINSNQTSVCPLCPADTVASRRVIGRRPNAKSASAVTAMGDLVQQCPCGSRLLTYINVPMPFLS